MATEYVAESAPPQPVRRSNRATLLIALIAFILGLVAMAYALREWGTALGLVRAGPPVNAAAAPAALAPAPRVIPVQAVTADELTARVLDLEERLTRISVSADAAAGNATRAEGLLIAIATRRALDRGAPLGYLETQLRDRFGQSQPRAVEVVLAAARQPVTLAGLRGEYERITPGLARPAQLGDWWQTIKREAAELIVVRRAGTASPASGERVERAQRALDDGEVERALAEVARMPGRARARAWMADARRYLEARRGLEAIETAAILQPRIETVSTSANLGAGQARAGDARPQGPPAERVIRANQPG